MSDLDVPSDFEEIQKSQDLFAYLRVFVDKYPHLHYSIYRSRFNLG